MSDATISLVLTMSVEDADRFLADWRLDPAAPVLTGGWQGEAVTVIAAESLGVVTYACGHTGRRAGCGGCDPGAIEYIKDDGGPWVRVETAGEE